jgi:hypothetical protein
MQDNFEYELFLKRQKALYAEKNEFLDTYYEKVSPFEFYRDLFPEGSFERKGHYEDSKANGIGIVVQVPSEGSDGAVGASERRGNGIALEIKGGGNARRCTLTDELQELDELVGKEFAIMSPVSYFGNSRVGRNARCLYALTFDLDGVDMPQLRDTIHQMNREFIPAATFIVNSGNGLHLYYLLDSPVAMYPQNQKFLKELKYALTRRIWNRYTSKIKEPQIQGVLQGFRVIGSGTKLGLDCPVVAYRYGKRVSIEYLLGFLPDTNGDLQRVTGILEKGTISLEEAKKKYPDWYERRIVRGEKRGRWTVKRDLYDWWLRKIETEIHVGHRFYGIMTLAIYAVKCNIPEDELRRDAYTLLKIFDDMSYDNSNRFTEDDVISALEMYNENYVTFPRDDIAKYSGIPIPANKRNWKKQNQHLEVARAVRDVKVKQQGKENWWQGNGRPSKEQMIREYMFEHPTVGKQIDIANALKIDRHTVSKYYKKIRAELDIAQTRELNIPRVVVENGRIVVRVMPSQGLSDQIVDELKVTVNREEGSKNGG